MTRLPMIRLASATLATAIVLAGCGHTKSLTVATASVSVWPQPASAVPMKAAASAPR